jgi:hypothetical protein
MMHSSQHATDIFRAEPTKSLLVAMRCGLVREPGTRITVSKQQRNNDQEPGVALQDQIRSDMPGTKRGSIA